MTVSWPAMRATRAYIYTYDVAAHCATVGTTPSLLGRDESARTWYAHMVYVSCMRWASHESYAGLDLHMHKRCCCTLCYCSTTPSLLRRDESTRTYVRMRIWFTCLACVGLAMRATAGLHTHKRCCCTLRYCSTTSSLLVRDDTVCSLCKQTHLREALLALCVLLV